MAVPTAKLPDCLYEPMKLVKICNHDGKHLQ